MASEAPLRVDTSVQPQLAQARVPLEQAGAAFETPDALGRTPIVVLPQRNLRIRIDAVALAAALLLGAFLATALDWSAWIVGLLFVGAGVLLVVGTMTAFFVRVPEGTSALLVRGGRHSGVLGPGTHVVMPWIIVSHVVTRRQIPFDLPPFQSPTRDNVSAQVDGLLTFSITDPVRFVYSIAAPDFDLVLQAACRDGLRSMLRQLTWSSVLEIGREQVDMLREHIGEHVVQYGVTIGVLNITHASPQADFLRSEEARQLATVQRSEQAARHALAQLRLQDEHALERLRVAANIERSREQLESQVHAAEMRRRATEIDAETQAFRLAHLEDLLARYPHAAEWEWQTERLGVARALAANNRSVLHLGRAADVVTTLWPDTIGDQGPADARPDRHVLDAAEWSRCLASDS